MPFGDLQNACPASKAGASLMPLDALEEEITTLAAQLSAATYRLLELIAELDRREGWGGWGMRSCAHWLTWKCGIGLVAAREKVRVARALEGLPAIGAAMRAGQLSYSKVRAMTRIATPAKEAALLSIALNGTASHVERVSQLYRRTGRALERDAAAAQHRDRELSYFWDEDGCLVLKARLAADQGALVVKALQAADTALLRDAAGADNASAEASATRAAKANAGRDESWHARQADALGVLAETMLAAGPQALAAGDRHLVTVHVNREGLAPSSDATEDVQCHLHDGPALARDVARRLACDASVVSIVEDADGAVLDVGRKTRVIPPALRRALEHRDRGCRFPGCSCTRFVDAHHVEHWADGGETRLDNLVLLCRHHHRLVHEGGFDLRFEDEQLVVHRPDGRVVREVPQQAVLSESGWETIQRKHESIGIAISARTGIPGWGGEHADYTYMLSALEDRDRPHAD